MKSLYSNWHNSITVQHKHEEREEDLVRVYQRISFVAIPPTCFSQSPTKNQFLSLDFKTQLP